jgi:hypothetical protein
LQEFFFSLLSSIHNHFASCTTGYAVLRPREIYALPVFLYNLILDPGYFRFMLFNEHNYHA